MQRHSHCYCLEGHSHASALNAHLASSVPSSLMLPKAAVSSLLLHDSADCNFMSCRGVNPTKSCFLMHECCEESFDPVLEQRWMLWLSSRMLLTSTSAKCLNSSYCNLGGLSRACSLEFQLCLLSTLITFLWHATCSHSAQ